MDRGKGDRDVIMVIGCAGIMLLVAATTTNGSPAAVVLAMLLMASGAVIGAAISSIWKSIHNRKKRRKDKFDKNGQ